MQKFASIESDDLIEPLRSKFQRAGVAEPDVVARLCAASIEHHRDSAWHDHFLNAVVDRLSRHSHAAMAEGGALLLAVLAALEEMDSPALQVHAEAFTDVIGAMIDRVAAPGRDLTAAFVASTRSRGVAEAMRKRQLCGELLARGLIVPQRIVDRNALRTLGLGEGGRHWENPTYQNDPTRLDIGAKWTFPASHPLAWSCSSKNRS